MRVADLMRRDFARLRRNDRITDAAKTMAESDSDVVLIEEEGRLAGLLTERDILVLVVAAGRDPSATGLWQVMSTSLFTCIAEDEVDSVADRMTAHGIEHVPVIDRVGRPIGLVTRRACLDVPSSGPES
jgi:CBS domain-containing protein